METKIYGSSDDLIELDGGICEEFNYYPDGGAALLAFSDGTLLELEYDNDGIWRIKALAMGEGVLSIVPGSSIDDTCDVATLTGNVTWCVLGERAQYNPAWGKKP